MKVSELKVFDAANFLTDEERIAAYLASALTDNDPAGFQVALGTVAKARGMTQLARDAGIKRESLYKSLGPGGNPEFGTIFSVVRALGLKLTVSPIDADSVMVHDVKVERATIKRGGPYKTQSHAVAAASEMSQKRSQTAAKKAAPRRTARSRTSHA